MSAQVSRLRFSACLSRQRSALGIREPLAKAKPSERAESAAQTPSGSGRGQPDRTDPRPRTGTLMPRGDAARSRTRVPRPARIYRNWPRSRAWNCHPIAAGTPVARRPPLRSGRARRKFFSMLSSLTELFLFPRWQNLRGTMPSRHPPPGLVPAGSAAWTRAPGPVRAAAGRQPTPLRTLGILRTNHYALDAESDQCTSAESGQIRNRWGRIGGMRGNDRMKRARAAAPPCSNPPESVGASRPLNRSNRSRCPLFATG